MPMYQTHCQSCSRDQSTRLSFQDYDRVKEGSHILSCECGGTQQLVFDPSHVSFVLKDGESGGWATKAAVENKYRAARRGVMARRERDHVKPNKLLPNHNGQIASSWAEAQDAARQSTYERVNREYGSREATRAAKESAKTYDKHVKQEAQ